MKDPFLERLKRPKALPEKKHGERAHSKFSASGSERWMACPGSVALSEGLPDKSSPWAKEGTEAHEVLEQILIAGIEERVVARDAKNYKMPIEMWRHGLDAANIILNLHRSIPDSEIMIETRTHLKFIHPDMFGTFDGAVVDHFGTLHVFDYKYGAGVPVSPGTPRSPNFQMVFYGIGLAHQFNWNFSRVRLWIIQPRIKGYEGPLYVDLSIQELKSYVDVFKRGVEQVEKYPQKYTEGSHCHWCKAKSICPLKREIKLEKAKSVFSLPPKGTSDGPHTDPEEIQKIFKARKAHQEDESFGEWKRRRDEENEIAPLKSEAEWRKEARRSKKARSK